MQQTASGMLAIKVAFCGVPMLIAIGLFIISIFMNIEKKYPDLPEQLAKMRLEKSEKS